jgi:cytochrome c oxidase subunit 2
VSVVVAILTVVVYVLLTAIYQLPPAASAEANEIDTLFNAHFFLISFLFSLVVGFMLYTLFAFRRRPDDEEEGDYFHGHTGLEIAWTIVPLGLVVFFGVWAAQMLGDITATVPNEMVVRVIGQQWAWSFEYPELDDMRSTELVVPVNQPIRLEMESLDVLHSFWVPEFRVKQDLVPGQTTTLRVTPDEIGDYKVRCAEICGNQHAYMLADVRVLSQADYESWVQENSVDIVGMEPAARGEQWYTQFGCNACHSLDGSVIVGPSWQGLYGHEVTLTSGETVTADEEYIRNSILNPNDQIVEGFAPNVMPQTFASQFADEEAKYDGQINIIDDLIAFIQTLNGESGDTQ